MLGFAWILSLSLMTTSCSSLHTAPFFIVRHIPSPAPYPAPRPQGQREGDGEIPSIIVKEKRFLLYRNDKDHRSFQNRQAVDFALRGEWKKAAEIWETLGTGDCAVTNNLAMASSLAGRSDLALGQIAEALRLCPEQPEIQRNYRSELILHDGAPVYFRSPEMDPESSRLKKD